VATNPHVARSLGMTLKDEATLHEALQGACQSRPTECEQ
jgi:hypothetical protein